MDHAVVTVEGFVATSPGSQNLREEVWSFALDQRAFGPRRLIVAFADRAGRLIGIAHAPRLDPPEAALGPCIEHLGLGAAAAVAFCDEPVSDGPPPPDLEARWKCATAIAESYGVRLVDWIACDDQLFRSTRLALEPGSEWWDVA